MSKIKVNNTTPITVANLDDVVYCKYKEDFEMISDYGYHNKICYNTDVVFSNISCDGLYINAKTSGTISICAINKTTKEYTVIDENINVYPGWNFYEKSIILGEDETIGIIGSVSYATLPENINGFNDCILSSKETTNFYQYVIGVFPLLNIKHYIDNISDNLENTINTIAELTDGFDYVDKTFSRMGKYSSSQKSYICCNTNPIYLGLEWKGLVIYTETEGYIDVFKVNVTNRTSEFLKKQKNIIGTNYTIFDCKCSSDETIGVRIYDNADTQYGSGKYLGFIEFNSETKQIVNDFPNVLLGYFPITVPSEKDNDEIKIEWSIPKTIYAVVGQEKSIYLDNIVNRNDDAPEYVVEVNKTFGNVDGRRFYFTPDTTGTKTVEFVAYQGKDAVETKTITIEVLSNTLTSQKTICCIGDSITEGRNMPYYVQQAFQTALTAQSIQPTFVGTKGGESGMGNKPTKHEGYWGRSYIWMATENTSPFWNPNTNSIDIGYYRSQHSIPQIDVVSLAMGFNGTDSEAYARVSLNSLKTLIAAFKADNANTKFIVQLVTYPAIDNVLQTNQEMRVKKKNSLYYFRSLCENEYNDDQDVNIIIGDLGLVYDRWFAYVRETVHPAGVYTNDNIQVVTDRVHPSDQGCEQMGSGIMPCILKMCQ